MGLPSRPSMRTKCCNEVESALSTVEYYKAGQVRNSLEETRSFQPPSVRRFVPQGWYLKGKYINTIFVCVCVCVCARAPARTQFISRVRLFVTPWTIICQTPLSMEFSRQEDEWLAISSSSGSSQLRDWTWVSGILCIGRRVLYH